jgi:ATP-dependent DNA helicase RecG
LENPNNIYEAPIITGSVTQIIERTLEYLNRMVVMQTIIKPKNDNHSIKFYTYPYQALEESVTNSLYHRDYREWEPVVITVEPKGITIQNIGGPDRSIPAADIIRGELLISKRYRNRRLGEYLKELEMTEGRSTGIPTIQNVLKANGSPRAIVVTDEERTFFRITIPCHEAAGNIIADIATREKTPDSSQEIDKNIPDVLKNVLKDVQKDVLKELSERQIVILELICTSPEATLTEMSRKLKVSDKTIQREFTAIRKLGINIERQDGRKEGKWVIKL